MKSLLLAILALALSVPAFATIAYVGGTLQTSGCVTAGVTGSGTCIATYTPTTGSAVVLFSRPTSTEQTPYAQDNNLNTMTQGQAAFSSTPAGYTISSFAGFAKSGATSYIETGMGNTNTLLLGEYSGVLSINFNPTIGSCSGTITANVCSGSGTSLSVGVTLDDANDFAVCAFAQQLPNAGGTYSSFVGNERQYESSSPTIVFLDNTSASAGATVTVGATLSSSGAWNAVCVELRTVSGTTPAYVIGQISPSGYVALAGPTGCPATGGVVACTWSLLATTAGSSYVVHMSDHSDQDDVQRTLVSGYACRSSNPCLSSSGDLVDTLTIPGSACRSYVSDSGSESDSNDNGYVVNGGGLATVITVTLSGSDPVNTERKILTLVEFVPSAGFTFAFDGCGTGVYTADAFSFAGMTVSGLTGTNDAVVLGWTGGTYSQVTTSPYAPPNGQGESIPNHMAIWIAINQVPSSGSLSTTTITALAGTSGGSGTAVALSYQAITGGTPGGHAIIF